MIYIIGIIVGFVLVIWGVTYWNLHQCDVKEHTAHWLAPLIMIIGFVVECCSIALMLK